MKQIYYFGGKAKDLLADIETKLPTLHSAKIMAMYTPKNR